VVDTKRFLVIKKNGSGQMSDIRFCRYDWKHERGDWVVEIAKDTDGHLNLYITNVKSDNLYEIEGDQHGEELHYRITTSEIEEAYRNERI
jgi:hypothetical protein